MSPGAGRRITTDAGFRMAARGRGGRVRYGPDTTRSGLPHMSRSGDGAAALVSELGLVAGAASDGFPSDRVTGFIPGGVDIAAGSVWSAEAVGVEGAGPAAAMVATVASLHCTTDCVTRT